MFLKVYVGMDTVLNPCVFPVLTLCNMCEAGSEKEELMRFLIFIQALVWSRCHSVLCSRNQSKNSAKKDQTKAYLNQWVIMHV